jgi:hypothetical protein
MVLDTSALRTLGDNFPPIKDRMVTLILIAHDKITQAFTVADKREMLRCLGQDDTLLAVWTGQWHSDAFGVSSEVLDGWKQDLLG